MYTHNYEIFSIRYYEQRNKLMYSRPYNGTKERQIEKQREKERGGEGGRKKRKREERIISFRPRRKFHEACKRRTFADAMA